MRESSGMLMANVPSSAVMVPFPESLFITAAPGIGFPVLSRTMPDNVPVFCAKRPDVPTIRNINDATASLYDLPIVWSVYLSLNTEMPSTYAFIFSGWSEDT